MGKIKGLYAEGDWLASNYDRTAINEALVKGNVPVQYFSEYLNSEIDVRIPDMDEYKLLQCVVKKYSTKKEHGRVNRANPLDAIKTELKDDVANPNPQLSTRASFEFDMIMYGAYFQYNDLSSLHVDDKLQVMETDAQLMRDQAEYTRELQALDAVVRYSDEYLSYDTATTKDALIELVKDTLSPNTYGFAMEDIVSLAIEFRLETEKALNNDYINDPGRGSVGDPYLDPANYVDRPVPIKPHPKGGGKYIALCSSIVMSAIQASELFQQYTVSAKPTSNHTGSLLDSVPFFDILFVEYLYSPTYYHSTDTVTYPDPLEAIIVLGDDSLIELNHSTQPAIEFIVAGDNGQASHADPLRRVDYTMAIKLYSGFAVYRQGSIKLYWTPKSEDQWIDTPFGGNISGPVELSWSDEQKHNQFGVLGESYERDDASYPYNLSKSLSGKSRKTALKYEDKIKELTDKLAKQEAILKKKVKKVENKQSELVQNDIADNVVEDEY